MNTAAFYWVDIAIQRSVLDTFSNQQVLENIAVRFYLQTRNELYYWYDGENSDSPVAFGPDIKWSVKRLLDHCRGLTKGDKAEVKVLKCSKGLELG